ncbi:MAG TPA: hypothetical protein VLL07_00425 [Pontiella sp.]|nr:hypothetical protein [Pontiella sp.]
MMQDLRRYGLAAGIFLVLVNAHGEQLPKESYSGSLRGTYDYRSLGSYEDHDGYAYWYLRGRNLAEGHVDLYTSGRLYTDFDGDSSTYADDPFIGLEDTSRQDDVRVLQLYVEMHDPKNTMALRCGRQYVDIADYIQMDGVQGMLFENKKLGGRVFAGKPVSYYSSTSGDLFAGASLVGRPWEGNRSRITYARYDDDTASAVDDHYFLDVRQQILEEVRTRAYLSVMNEDVRMGGLDLYYMSLSDRVLDAELGIRRWGNFDADTRAYSPLVQALGDLEAYTTGYGRVTSQLLAWLYLSPGIYVRHSDDSDDTNRSYEKYDLSLIFEPTDALNATIALEYWDVDDDDRFFGVTGDIRYRHRKIWEASLGVAYVDYTYYQFSDFTVSADGGSIVVGSDGTRTETSPDAFSYFLRGKWNISENMTMRVSGEIEDDSTEDDLGYRVRTSFEVRL